MNAELEHYDLAVIGGGPAGSAAAYHAAMLGLKTILFEKEEYPRDKPCGGALSARNIPLLGENALNAINCDIEEIRIFGPSYNPFVYKNTYGHYMVRRVFDHAMARDAQDAGAVLLEGCPVTGVESLPGGGYEVRSEQKNVSAGYVIFAGGFKRNAIMKGLGVDQKYEDDYLAATVVSETPIDNKILADAGIEGKILCIFFGAVPNGYGWFFVKNGYLNIGIGATARLLKGIGAVPAYRDFVARLRDMNYIPGDLELSVERGFPLPYKRTVRRTVFDRMLLVGDAAGFVSPVSGEGIYYAIKGGQLAARAVAGHLRSGKPLETYEKEWRRDFGKDLNRYGRLLQKQMYKSRRRMEWVVALGRADRGMARIFNNMIYGIYNYRQTILKTLLRLPAALLKLAVGKGR